MTNLSTRARKALEILRNGGQVRERLERNSYTGREQFRTQFLDANGRAVAGFGLVAKDELHRAGLLRMTEGGTSVSTYWRAAPEVAAV